MAQLFDVIFTDLRSSRNTVNRLLSLGIIFALVGHFYVVEPYFQYREQERAAQETQANVEEIHAQLSAQLDLIKQVSQSAKETLASIQRRIEEYPEHLRETLPKIQGALESGPSSQTFQQSAVPARVGEIVLPSDITTFEAGVRWYIENWFSDLIAELQTGVVNPVWQLREGQRRAEESKLDDMAQQAMEHLRAYLNSVDPEFWRSYEGGKVLVTRELQRVVEESFGPVEREVSHLLKKTEEDLEKQESDLRKIEKNLTEVQTGIERLASRLKSLESPLDPIPVDLTDLITLFPLLIVTMVVMVTVALRKSSRLYITLWQKFIKERGDADSAAFQHYADCWYLPLYQNVTQPLLLLACLAINVGIFVRASLLVMREPALFVLLTSEIESFRRSMFIGAYVVGAFVIIGCVWLIYKTLRRVSIEGRSV